jgi:hypothetical protein
MAILFTDFADCYAFNPAAFVNRKTADLGLTPASSYYCEQATPASGRATFNLRPTTDYVAPAANAPVVTLGGTGFNASGVAYALSEVTPYVTKTATGTVVGVPCELAGYDCTVAAGTIQIRDGGAAGTIIVPSTTLALGRVEFAYKRALAVDCYIELSAAATVNVLVG